MRIEPDSGASTSSATSPPAFGRSMVSRGRPTATGWCTRNGSTRASAHMSFRPTGSSSTRSRSTGRTSGRSRAGTVSRTSTPPGRRTERPLPSTTTTPPSTRASTSSTRTEVAAVDSILGAPAIRIGHLTAGRSSTSASQHGSRCASTTLAEWPQDAPRNWGDPGLLAGRDTNRVLAAAWAKSGGRPRRHLRHGCQRDQPPRDRQQRGIRPRDSRLATLSRRRVSPCARPAHAREAEESSADALREGGARLYDRDPQQGRAPSEEARRRLLFGADQRQLEAA